MPADYDGDDIADFAVSPPNNGVLVHQLFVDGTSWVIPYGTEATSRCREISVPLLFDSDHLPPEQRLLVLTKPIHWGLRLLQYGQDGDVPVPRDENTGGLTNAAVYRPAAAAYWFVRNPFELPTVFQYGTLGDKPRYRRSFLVVSPPANNGGSEGHN